MSAAKSELSPAVLQERVAERLRAIDFIREISAASITGDSETGYLTMRRLDGNTEQEFRSMAVAITGAKAIEIAKAEPRFPDTSVSLSDNATNTTIVSTQRVLYAVQKEMAEAARLHRIPESMKPFVHNDVEKVEDRVLAATWNSGTHIPNQATSTSSFDVEALTGTEKSDLIKFLRSETQKVQASGQRNVAELDVKSFFSREGNNTIFTVDDRVKDAMLERITAERQAIDAEVQKELSRPRAGRAAAGVGR